MKKKLWIVLLLFAALLVTFSIHFYIVTSPDTNERMEQLARIDFKQALDSVEAGVISSYVKGLEGVSATYFNIPDGILVYSFFTDSQQTTDKVFQQVVALNNYKAVKYVVNEEQMNSGCPISNPNSLLYRVYVYYKKMQ